MRLWKRMILLAGAIATLVYLYSSFLHQLATGRIAETVRIQAYFHADTIPRQVAIVLGRYDRSDSTLSLSNRDTAPLALFNQILTSVSINAGESISSMDSIDVVLQSSHHRYYKAFIYTNLLTEKTIELPLPKKHLIGIASSYCNIKGIGTVVYKTVINEASNFSLMNAGYRTSLLEQSIAAYRTSGHLLLVADPDTSQYHYQPYFELEAGGDDLGIYLAVPFIAGLLHIGLHSAYLIFTIGLLLLSLCICCYACMLFAISSSYKRLFIGIGCYLAIYSLFILDVYVVYYLAVALALLVMAHRERPYTAIWVAVLLLISFACGFLNLVRINAGTITLLYCIYIIFSSGNIPKLRRWILIGALVVAFMLPSRGLHAVLESRNHWMTQNGYALRESANLSHPFWHAIYLGLAYLPNNAYHIYWDDYCAVNKARAEVPSLKDAKFITSLSRYENYLKEQYISIVTHDPGFVLKTYLLKSVAILIGVLPFFLLLLYYFNAAAWWQNKWTLLPVLLMSMYAFLPPLLSMPYRSYGLHFLCAVGFLSIAYLEKYFLYNSKKR